MSRGRGEGEGVGGLEVGGGEGMAKGRMGRMGRRV